MRQLSRICRLAVASIRWLGRPEMLNNDLGDRIITAMRNGQMNDLTIAAGSNAWFPILIRNDLDILK